MLFECAGLLSWRLVQIIEGFIRITSSFTLIVVVEGFRIDEHGDDDMTDTALDQVLEGDAVGERWLSHVPELVLEVVDLVLGLNLLLQLLDDLPEEHIDHECVDGAFVVDI